MKSAKDLSSIFLFVLGMFGSLSAGSTLAGELVLTTATLSQARSDLAATAAGGKALFAGGMPTDGGYSSVVDIYDANTGSWSTAALSQARADLAATAVGNLAFFAGGFSASGRSNVVDIYNATTGQWSTASLSVGRGGLAATAVGNKVIFAGGLTGTTYSNVVDIYDVQTGLWSTATLSQARILIAATTVSSKAMFAGGLPDDAPFLENIVDIYHDDTGSWTTDSIPNGGWAISVATTVGSQAMFPYDDKVNIYDNNLNQWSTEPLSEGREGLAATTVGNLALFAGGVAWYIGGYLDSDLNDDGFIGAGDLTIVLTHWGQTVPLGSNWQGDASGDGFVGGADYTMVLTDWGRDDSEQYFDVVDVYDNSTGLWSLETLSVPRHSLSGTTVGDVAIFAGGHGESGYSNMVDIFSLAGEQATAVPEPATLATIVALTMVFGLRRR